jgi:hypothetical protein
MQSYNPIYRKFIDDRNQIIPSQMVRASFYLVKEYQYVDGTKGRFNETTAPIIYTLFVSKAKDIVHCVKVSNIRPELIKRFFGKFVNEETEELQMKGGAKAFYQKVVSTVPIVTNEAYRTYKLSGLSKVIELNMDVDKLTPSTKTVTSVDIKTQIKNK